MLEGSFETRQNRRRRCLRRVRIAVSGDSIVWGQAAQVIGLPAVPIIAKSVSLPFPCQVFDSFPATVPSL